jgi:hypothetical protein
MTPICFTDDFNLIENCGPDDALSIGKNRSSLSYVPFKSYSKNGQMPFILNRIIAFWTPKSVTKLYKTKQNKQRNTSNGLAVTWLDSILTTEYEYIGSEYTISKPSDCQLTSSETKFDWPSQISSYKQSKSVSVTSRTLADCSSQSWWTVWRSIFHSTDCSYHSEVYLCFLSEAFLLSAESGFKSFRILMVQLDSLRSRTFG